VTGAERQSLERRARAGEARAQVELGNALLAEHEAGSEGFRDGIEWLTRAAEEDGDTLAQWSLGAVYLQVATLPRADERAAHWLQRAADAGLAPALDRLADLHLLGRGVARDDTRAFHLLEHLAGMGYAPAWSSLAYMHTQGIGTAPDQRAGARALLRAVGLGHPPAYFGLGIRFALGAGAPEDRVFAHALLQRAADADYPFAAGIRDKLGLAGERLETARRWRDRLKANFDEAKPLLDAHREAAAAGRPQGELDDMLHRIARHFRGIDHPAIMLDEAGALNLAGGGGESAQLVASPASPETLSRSPRVLVSRDFVTTEECAHLMAQTRPRLSTADEYVGVTAVFAEKELLDGSSALLGPLEADVAVRNIERRIAALTERPINTIEPLSVVRYAGGQQYRTHVDYLTDDVIAANRRRGDRSGQRIATFLIYLLAPESGGGTHYPEADLVVEGEWRMAAMHYNALPDGRIDRASVHAGLPVERGEKWIARTALHEGPLYGTDAS
jgi:prolyl 4-hydroxylase